MTSRLQRHLARLTSALHRLLQRAAEDYIAIGHTLQQVKDMLPHGEWLAWLEREFQASERTAQRYMERARLYQQEGLGAEPLRALDTRGSPPRTRPTKSDTVSDLPADVPPATPVAAPSPALHFFDDVPMEDFP